ncbi:MAG: carbohydrate ABC transporter permease [Chloroflexi bacterium]|nr:carbohydrate ABC transporter permease [Chloroflexota bacterium]
MSAVASGSTAAPVPAVNRPGVRLRIARTGRRRSPAVTVVRYILVGIALIFFLFPIIWIAGISIKLPADYLSNPPVWIPSEITFRHYQSVMAEKGTLALTNSLVIAGIATLISVLVGSLAAYSLARFNTGGRHLGFWLISQRMLPPVVLVIPIFLLMREAGKIHPRLGIDQHLPLIALYAVFNLPYVIWMMRSYFTAIPAEIEESAMIDGATRLGVLARITLPLALPGLVATTTFAFIFAWTEFLFAVVLTRTNAVTLPVVIAGFTGGQGSNWGRACALSVVATAPVFILVLLVQRHFVRGLTLGAVRG